MTLEEQVEQFKAANLNKYTDDLYSSFLKYWLTDVKGKPRWIVLDTFKIGGRLATWLRHNKKYANDQIIKTFKYHLQKKQHG